MRKKIKYIFETDRLYLREFIFEDGFHFFHLNNDPDVIKFTGNKPFESLDEANLFIKNYSNYKKNGYGRWAVCLKETNEFLGWCGLKYEEAKEEIDLGYRFYKKYWGNGYATEAAIAYVNYGFEKLNLKKIVGRSYEKNIASIQVLKNCNLKFTKKFFLR